jgi:hypothetical protein
LDAHLKIAHEISPQVSGNRSEHGFQWPEQPTQSAVHATSGLLWWKKLFAFSHRDEMIAAALYVTNCVFDNYVEAKAWHTLLQKRES